VCVCVCLCVCVSEREIEYVCVCTAEGDSLHLAPQLVQELVVPGRLPIGTVLNLRTTTLQKCEAVPRRARI